MRFIPIPSPPKLPAGWSRICARRIAAVNSKGTQDLRSVYIKTHSSWVDLKSWLAKLSDDKCWYCEAKSTRAPLDVDHFRPKLAVTVDGIKLAGHEGYYWLAYIWQNFRLSCQRCNRPEKGDAELLRGKANEFPIRDETQRCFLPSGNWNAESPRLLDPCREDDCKLLAHGVDGEVKPLSQPDSWEYERARYTIDRLGFNEWNTPEDKRSQWQTLAVLITVIGNSANPAVEAELSKYLSTDHEYASFFSICHRHASRQGLGGGTSMNTSTLIQKMWNFCHTLRDDGVGYGDYLEQLTYLLFLKMAYEYAQEPYNRKTRIPKGHDWMSLRSRTGEPLEAHYLSTLHKLGQEPGMLGAIFFKAQNKIQDPAKLSRLVQMIDEQSWVGMDTDTKGDLYEGLLQKNAEDTKSGAGQYFTPRALIEAMVACMRPEPMKKIGDPACGTGGFFLGAYNWLTRAGGKLDPRQKKFLRDKTFHGNEIVPNTRRLCLMNLFLHNIGELEGEPAVDRSDALIAEPKIKVDYVLANPPFGKKSSMTITNEEGEEDRDALTYERQDFWETTSNKQLNFLQHIVTMLKVDGKAAVVLPDNVLFEGGAGEKIRRKLLENCDVHTILRLPTGIFYAQGVKANVVFFDNAPKDGRVHTKGVWFYDLRTNKHFTLKTRMLKFDDLREFVVSYHPENRHKRKENERFKYFRYKDLVARDKANLDIFWLKDDSLDNLDELPPPDVLQQEIIDHLEAALAAFRDVAAALPKVSS